MTGMEDEANALSDRVLTWFNEHCGGDYWERPDDLLKDIMGWMSEYTVRTMQEKQNGESV